MKKKTLVIGASLKKDRYSYKAIKMLRSFGHPVEAIGVKEGNIEDIYIYTEKIMFKDIHTISLYLSSIHQAEYFDYIIYLKPQRLIFNPGSENPELYRLAREANIQIIMDCTLMMLQFGTF